MHYLEILSSKYHDPSSFIIFVTIGVLLVRKVLLDLRANINLISLSMMNIIGNLEVQSTRMTLQLADKSNKYLYEKQV